jgi:hypothetical protein
MTIVNNNSASFNLDKSIKLFRIGQTVFLFYQETIVKQLLVVFCVKFALAEVHVVSSLFRDLF